MNYLFNTCILYNTYHKPNWNKPIIIIIIIIIILKTTTKSFKRYIEFNFILHVIRMSFVSTRMSHACHSYALVYHLYVTPLYVHVICVSVVCTRMSPACHSYVLLCYLYVTRLWFYHEQLAGMTKSEFAITRKKILAKNLEFPKTQNFIFSYWASLLALSFPLVYGTVSKQR